MNDLSIRIQNLTDYHLNDFLTCPRTFWKKHIMKKEQERFDREDFIELTISQTLLNFFSLPPAARSDSTILGSFGNLIKKYPGDYDIEIIMNQLTVHLLKDRDHACPLITYEKMSISVLEWDLHLSMTIPLAFGTGDSFIIKKFVMHENPEFIRSWAYFCIFFCQHAFHQIPAKLEMINLFTGSTTVIVPTDEDILKSKDYMELLKESMKDPSMYFNHLSKLAQ